MRQNWYTDTPQYSPRPRLWQGFLARLTPAVKWIMAITVGAFLLQAVLSFSSDKITVQTFERFFELDPSLALTRLHVWQFVTYAFLHDRHNIFHILFNMLIVFFFAPAVERKVGTRRFVALYLVSAAGAGLAHSVLAYSHPVLGASGAMLGVIAAFACYFPNSVIYLMMLFPIRAKHFVWVIAAIDLLSAMSGSADANRVASFAHLGGLATGFLLVRYGARFMGFFAGLEARRREGRLRSDLETRHRVDHLLAKVHREGMGSLTLREKMFLKRASKRFKRDQ